MTLHLEGLPGTDRVQPPARSVLDLIGQTPMVEVSRFDTGRCRLFLKLESQNPGGSIKEGILGGSSTGTLLAAALRYCREQSEPRRVVSFVCDSGNKYLSKVFDDAWLAEQGLSEREQHGDLRDIVARSHRDGSTVTVGPDETPLDAYGKMRRADVSQLPVLDRERLVGIVDESDILARVEGPAEGRWDRFRSPVRQAMTTEVHTLQARQTLDALLPVFDRDEVAIILDGEEFLGLVTRIDLINHLRHSR